MRFWMCVCVCLELVYRLGLLLLEFLLLKELQLLLLLPCSQECVFFLLSLFLCNTSGTNPSSTRQIAQTAAGVALGSTMGHGLSSMLFGGSSSAATEAPAAAPQSSFESERRSGASCEIQSKGEQLFSALCGVGGCRDIDWKIPSGEVGRKGT